MKKINYFIYLLLITSILSIFLLVKEHKQLNETIIRLQDNVSELVSDNLNLKLTTDELIANKDKKHIREIDSLLKAHKVQIKNLEKYRKVEIVEIYIDTSTALILEPEKIDEEKYQIPYEKSLDCTYISGRMISKDIETQLFFDSIKSENTVYIFEFYKKTFWDRIFFRKGKKQTKVSSKCGEVNLDSIDIIND